MHKFFMISSEVSDTGNRTRFLYNGIILTIAALIIRTVSVSFNVYITSVVGAEGTGIYQLVMSVYSPALTLATAGVSLSSSRLVAEELGKRRGGRYRSVFMRCLICSLAVSLPVSILLFVIAPTVSARWIGSNGACRLLRLLCLGLPFISLSSCINGFFTAIRKASKSAFLQLCEQFFRIFLTYAIITETGSSGIKCLTAVIAGSVCADVFSFILAIILYKCTAKRMQRQRGTEREPITSRVLGITLPVSFSSFLRSSLVALEHILIPKGLKKSGADYSSAMASYGILTGMAMPIIFFPASFLYSFCSLTIPELAEANERKEYDKIRLNINHILYSFLIFSVGAAGMIAYFCNDISLSIYGNISVSKFLLVLAPLIPFMYLDTAVDSMLKGLGEQIYTMRINVIDAASSVIAVTLLVPKMGIMGYVVVILISELINFSFSLHRLKKVTGIDLSIFKNLPRLILSIIGAVALSQLISLLPITLKAATVLKIASSIVLYVCFLIVFGAIKIPCSQIRAVIKTLRDKYNLKKDKERKNAAIGRNIPASAENIGAAFKN